MKTENEEAKFIAAIRNKLDRSVDRLDAELIFGLRRARQQALQQQKPSRTVHRWPMRWGLAAAAIGLVLATTFFTSYFRTEWSKPMSVSSVEDLELLSASETPEFFSDLDFYAWLAEEMDHEV